MKLCQFIYEDAPQEIRVGLVVESPRKVTKVIDINKADPSIPRTLIEILQKGLLGKVKALRHIKVPDGSVVPLHSIALKSPITGMDKILCAELNYTDAYENREEELPHEPAFHTKFPSSVIGPSDYLKINTDIMREIDWGVHLAVIFSTTGTKIPTNDVFKYLLGCTVAQDIWARDWTAGKNGGQLILGRGIDTFCPLGPWIVTFEELGFPEQLEISCSVNGVVRQKSNTSNLVHDIRAMVEHLSSVMTFFPGDVILTGTPPGAGFHYHPPECLKPTDVITSEIQKIGVLTTNVATARDCSCNSKTCYNKLRPC